MTHADKLAEALSRTNDFLLDAHTASDFDAVMYDPSNLIMENNKVLSDYRAGKKG